MFLKVRLLQINVIGRRLSVLIRRDLFTFAWRVRIADVMREWAEEEDAEGGMDAICG